MKAILREEKSGVSEIVGTILILAMTVTLFSVIIVWVSSAPTPVAQTRVDISSAMAAINPGATPTGVNITLTQTGGEALYPVPTIIYITDQAGSGPQSTYTATLHLYNRLLVPNPNGLIDGSNSVWSIGKRWVYQASSFSVSDSITITVVDSTRGTVVWSGSLNQQSGRRPPVFLNVWASSVNNGMPNPVYEDLGFYLYATVMSPNGNLNPNSVFANITVWPGCGKLQMSPDPSLGSDVFILGSNGCTAPPYPLLQWTGSYILLNATDTAGNMATTRFVLNVAPNPTTITNTQTIPSQLWQYIGFVQIRTGQVWLSNQTLNYSTTNTFSPFEVSRSELNSPGAIFHFKMANHGNTTIFIDGFTEAFFTNTQSPGSSQVMFIVAPCSTAIQAGAGGLTAYPGTATINTFSYATYGSGGNMGTCQSNSPVGVFDINPTNQEAGGTPYTVMTFALKPFSAPAGPNWPAPGSLGMTTYFINILVAGMAGPANYTYAMLTQTGQYNPYGCQGLGPGYNPINHLNDANPQCRTDWYAQVVPFNAMIMFG